MAEHDSHDCFRLSQLVLPREPLLRLYRLIALAIPSIASRNFRIGAAYADTAFKPWLKQGEAISEGGGCYWSLVVSVEEFPGAGSRVNFAEAVRLVAKQWLGEPGTHFDWTFHTRFSGETIRVEIKAKETPNHPQPVGAWDVAGIPVPPLPDFDFGFETEDRP